MLVCEGDELKAFAMKGGDRTVEDGITIISCGTLREDLEGLQAEGLLEGVSLVFTEPCLKERPRQLEEQLKEKLAEVEPGSKVLVVYGSGCFIDTSDPERDIDRMIGETGIDCTRIKEHSCVEMMLSEEDKEILSGGLKVYWVMPAWIENREDVYHEWDLGKRNQTFPQNNIALLLDGRGYFMDLMERDPERILEFSDWMGIPLDSRDIDLERFKGLILAAVEGLKK